jgi:hypothetical protein
VVRVTSTLKATSLVTQSKSLRLHFLPILIAYRRWMDFPREGNGSSFQHARRQFNLIDDPLLRYRYLYEFDKVMNNTESKYKWLSAPQVCNPFSRAAPY